MKTAAVVHISGGKGISYFTARFAILFLLALTFYPFLQLINMSLKSNTMIKLDFLGLPSPLKPANYIGAWDFVQRPIMNSLFICAVCLLFIIMMVSMSGYAFGRLEFRGKRFFFSAIIAVLMIPYTLLLVPNYRIVTAMGFLNTYMAMILPYIAGQQIFGIVLARSFYGSLPQELFDAARIDGANEAQTFLRIALPLSTPTLITVGVTCVVAMYNDYIWPTIVLTTGDKMKTFCQIVFNTAAGRGSSDLGLMAAAFIIGTLPLLIITCSCLKYYLRGMIEGAVKG
jgi:ABC-type glycerol-3-phosphate transport system permease component